MNFEYAGILAFFFFLSLYLYKKYSLKFFENRKQAYYFWGILFVIGTIWDNFAVWRQHWIFPNVMGINIGLVPIEDYIFFFICGFFILTLYHVIKKEIK